MTPGPDLLPAEDGSNRHIRGDVRDHLADGWDLLMVAHPAPRLCNSGVRWLHTPPPGRTLPDMWAELDEGADLSRPAGGRRWTAWPSKIR